MLDNLPGTIRDIKAAVITGLMLMVTSYLLFFKMVQQGINPSDSFADLIEILKPIHIVWIIFACAYILGSIYLDGIETFVDFIHRRHLVGRNKSPLRYLSRVWAPLSARAIDRLNAESSSFLRANCGKANVDKKLLRLFELAVARDILWMEGKLVGTEQQPVYSQMRSEGEFKLGTSFLLTPCFISLALHLGVPLFGWLITVVVLLISVPLLFDQGFYQYRKANSFLAHHVADGTILTPSMESLQRTKDLAAIIPL